MRSQPPPPVRQEFDQEQLSESESQAQLRDQDKKIQAMYVALTDKEKELAARRNECEQLKVEVDEARTTIRDLEHHLSHLTQQQQDTQDAVQTRDRLIQEERNRVITLQRQLVDLQRASEENTNGRSMNLTPNPAEL